MPIGRRGRLRNSRDGDPGGARDRPGRRDRPGADRREDARLEAVRPPGNPARIGQRAQQLAPDRGQPALGRGTDDGPLCRDRRPVRGWRRHRRRAARGSRRDRVRGDGRPRTDGRVRSRDPPDARGPSGPDPDSLQHRSAGGRPVRYGARGRPGRAQHASGRCMFGSTRPGRTCRAPGLPPGSWPRPASRTR